MADEVVIDRRFRGPPASANGGYTSGLLAEALGARCAEVNLRRPPPLDTALTVNRDGDEARMLDGGELVADARPLDSLVLQLESPPPLHAAEDADARSSFYDDHAFPGCFVCGPARDAGDGLCIYPGELDGHRAMACAWTPDGEFADASGSIRERIVWAALDCPSGIAAHHFAPDETTMVLARLRGYVERPIEAGRPHIVVGWMLGRDGRKHRSATAIFDAAGEPRAWAEALWIELRQDDGE